MKLSMKSDADEDIDDAILMEMRATIEEEEFIDPPLEVSNGFDRRQSPIHSQCCSRQLDNRPTITMARDIF